MHMNDSLTPPRTPSGLVGKIAGSLGIGETTLNEVDFDDFFVSETVAETLQELASHLMKSTGEPLKGQKIKAYWVDDSKELVLCAQATDGLHLVRVPEEHWKMKPRRYH